MNNRFLFRTLSSAFGIALLLAGLFFNGGRAISSEPQVAATSTPDRLAKPTLPAAPSQADLGAQDYWLYCLPCHGDKGQGLTDEFRQTYPPEEQYCWERGCHGERPYESGFTLPAFIPGVIGPNAVGRFADAAQLNSYIRAAMPYWKPGSLTEEEAWRVTAFILRENGLWDGLGELNASNAAGIGIQRGTPTPLASPQQVQVEEGSGANLWLAFPGAIVVLFLLFFVLKKVKNKATI